MVVWGPPDCDGDGWKSHCEGGSPGQSGARQGPEEGALGGAAGVGPYLPHHLKTSTIN